MSSKQKRIFLWSAPRCTTSAFMWCMLNKPNTKAVKEPFWRAFYFGPEKGSDRFTCDHEEYSDRYTYANTVQGLANGYGHHEMIFVDMAYHMFDASNKFRHHIPQGFKHTMLIRDPHLSIPALYKILKTSKGWERFVPSEGGFIQLYQLYQKLLDKGEEVLIIDSHDLLNQPEAMLRMYCGKVGIEYCDSMVNWREMTEADREFYEEFPGWHETLFKSRTLLPPKPINSDMSDLPDELRLCIEQNLEAYQKLYDLRSTPS